MTKMFIPSSSNFFNLCFFILLFSSLIITMISESFILWISMEMASMTFVIMMNHMNLKKASLTFYLISTLASFMILMGLSLSYSMPLNLILLMGIWLKLAIYPLNYWMNLIMKEISYDMMFTTLVLMKLIPIILFTMIIPENKMIMSMLLISGIMPTLLAFNINYYPLLLNYSSMYNTSFIIIASYTNDYLIYWYFLFYSITTLMTIKILNEFKIYHKNSMNYFFNKNKFMFNIIMFINAQLPPFTTFTLKWMMLQNMMTNHMYLYSLLYILASIIMCFNYLNFTNIIYYNYSMKYNYKFKPIQINKIFLNYFMFMSMIWFLMLFNYFFI